MWLKKIAGVLLKGLQFATGFIPLVSGVIPQHADQVQAISDDLTKVAGMVTIVETIAGVAANPMTGPEKLAAAVPLVGQVILQADFMVGKKIKDQAKFSRGVASLASGMADVLDSIEGDVPVVDKA